MKPILLTAAALALAAFTGCKTHDAGPYLPVNPSVAGIEDTAKFVLLDKGAQYSVTCTGLQESRLPDGRLQVTANLRNRENRRIQIQANCVFKDAQGFAVEDTPFRTVFLDENAQEGVRFVSANNQAQRYTVRVRQAR